MIDIKVNKRDVQRLGRRKLERALSKAARRASSTSLRDMRSEAVKRIKARKRLKVKVIRDALVQRKNRSSDVGRMSWGLQVKGDKMPLAAYPHRASKKRGVSVTVNKGKRTRLPHAFVARMRSGHQGIFERVGTARLPIRERLGSRPVDALLHAGEADGVRERARRSFADAFERLYGLELDKLRAQ